VSLLLQRIRDEAHRFANAYQQKKRSETLQSSFLSVPGIGKKTIEILRKTYGSLLNCKEVPEQELAQLIGVKRAKLLLNFYKGSHHGNL